MARLHLIGEGLELGSTRVEDEAVVEPSPLAEVSIPGLSSGVELGSAASSLDLCVNRPRESLGGAGMGILLIGWAVLKDNQEYNRRMRNARQIQWNLPHWGSQYVRARKHASEFG